MSKKYKWKIVLVVLAISTVGFAIFDLVLYHNLKNYLFAQTFDEIRIKTGLAVNTLNRSGVSNVMRDRSALYEIACGLRTIVNARVTVIDTTGVVLTDSDVARDRVPFMDNHLYRPEVQGAVMAGWGQNYRRSDTLDRRLFYSAAPVVINGRREGYLRLAYYAQHFEDSMSNIKNLIAAANIVGLALLFLLALYVSIVITNPISRLATAARRITSGDFDETFPISRKDEIGTLACVLNQLTERMKAQIKQIADERTKLQHILTGLDSGIIVIDNNKRILHVNPELFRILELDEIDAAQKNVFEIIRSNALSEAINRTLGNRTKESGEFDFYGTAGKKYVFFIVTPFLVPEEQLAGVLIQLQDISKIKRLEAIRRDFVANASHELKTPLTTIVGYTETALEKKSELSSSQTVQFLRRILEQARRLDFLISDLLQLSELERETPLQLESASIVSITRECIAAFKKAALQKSIKIMFDPRERAKVKVDRESIRTVLNNLLDNAIKYTPPSGQVTVRISQGEPHRIKIEVVDTGIGIDPKYHDRIFQRFYRVDKGRSRALGGTGLGLAIVKHIIERHGSTMHLESELGRGSRFWFELERA